MSAASNRLLGKPAGSTVKLAPFSSSSLFGNFSPADAMFAPVVNRLQVYDVTVTAATRAYTHAMMALPTWQEWRAQAEAETWIIGKYEAA